MANDMTPFGANAPFELPQFFIGQTRAFGVFEDRFGRVRRRFDIQIIGRWEGTHFLLEEAFKFDDGEVDRRVWRIIQGENGAFRATTPDCIGAATGQVGSNQVEMAYKFKLRLKSRSLTVAMKDRYYRLSPHRVLNRTTVTAFGFKIGEVTAVFERLPST